MNTRMEANRSRIFILAHADDELMALPLLHTSPSDNVFIFLTSGSAESDSHLAKESRLEEVKTWVSWLNNRAFRVQFYNVTDPFFVSDSQLSKDFRADHFKNIMSIVNSVESPFDIVSTSFEGAHPDHDAASLIAAYVARNVGCRLINFSTYRNFKKSSIFFRFMNPINPQLTVSFSRWKIIKIAFLGVMKYKSQWRTWVGLGPILIWKYLFALWTSDLPYSIENPRKLECAFYENRKRASLMTEIRNLEKLASEIEKYA